MSETQVNKIQSLTKWNKLIVGITVIRWIEICLTLSLESARISLPLLSNSGCQIQAVKLSWKMWEKGKPIIQRWFQYTKEIYDQSDHFCSESFEMTFKFNLIFKAVSFIISSYIRFFYMWPWSNLNTHLLKGAELCIIFTNILGGYSVVLPLRSSVSKCLL